MPTFENRTTSLQATQARPLIKLAKDYHKILTRRSDALRNAAHQFHTTRSTQSRRKLRAHFRAIFGLTRRTAHETPERMIPVAANMARRAVSFPDIQERFAHLWEDLMRAQAKARPEMAGELREEAQRQIDMMREIESGRGMIGDLGAPAPMIAAAQSFLTNPERRINSRRQASCTSCAPSPARLGL